jgi:hypothetical protein
MVRFTSALAALVAVAGFTAIAPKADAAVVGIGIGVEPACPYGYYD